MTLADELERAAAAAAVYGEVGAVLAAEPAPGRRAYVVALGERRGSPSWLVLDAELRPAEERERVREAASIVVLSELAGELAGGGQLEELREQLAQVRLTEQPPGIEEAEEAALALERTIGAPPMRRLAGLPRRGRRRARRPSSGPSATTPRRSLTRSPRRRAPSRPSSPRSRDGTWCRCARVKGMEGGGSFGFPFGGDPEDLLRKLREFAEQQAESVQEAQREQFATLTLNTAVELTSAALSQVNVTGTADEQAIALRDAMRVLFPEAVALVSAARQGFMRE